VKLVSLIFVLIATIVYASGDAAVSPQVQNPAAPVVGGAEAMAIPQMLSYQGKLTDTTGIPVPDGDYSVVFRLYTAPSGGSPVWNETQSVTTEDGLFSVLLGSVTPIGSMPDAGAAYLAMTVDGGAELTPRLRLASAAYSYLSGRAADADLLQGKDTTALDSRYVNEAQANSVTGAMLVDGTVQTADLADTTVTMAKIARAGATTGQVVKWSGSAWAPGPDNTGGGSGVTNVYQDTGIICVPNPITSTGNVKLDLSYSDTRYVNESQANSVTSAMITDGNVTSADIRDTTVNTAELKDAAVTMPKLNQAGATTGQVIKWTGSAWAPRNDSFGSGGSGDNAWVRGTPDSVLFTAHRLGIARGESNNALYGDYVYNHTNFGYQCTTGTNGISSYQYCTIGGGGYNTAGAYGATVAGGGGNKARGIYATISGGSNSAALDTGSTVGGGRFNYAPAKFATVGGGYADTAVGVYAAVLSGHANQGGSAAADTAACVAGGYDNVAGEPFSFVGGGYANWSAGRYATIAGGSMNDAWGHLGAALSGYNNMGGNSAADTGACVAGGYENAATVPYAFVGGGTSNYANANYATVGGGRSNLAGGNYSFIGGGDDNSADGVFGAALSGYSNIGGDAGADTGACVAGGYNNSATASFGFVGGGWDNDAPGRGGVVSGGGYNTASGSWSTVDGGYDNTAAGFGATVAGGRDNAARGSYSLAAGRYARANHPGSFVWSDSAVSASESVYTTGDRQFRARARGGTWFFSNAGMTTGAYLAPNSNSWESACGSMTKEDFRPVDKKALLERVASLRVRDFKMKDQNDGTRHIGPVAQDFYATFGYGGTETGINLADADGVLLAAVQALYEQNQAQQAEIEALKAELKRR